MRSRGRVLLETGLRALALAALGALFWLSVTSSRHVRVAEARGTDVDSALLTWSTRASPAEARVQLTTAPNAIVRDWMAALTHAGTAIRWRGVAPPPIALVVEPVPDPRYTTRAWLAAPAGTRVQLRDELGIIDSAAVAFGGGRVTLPRPHGTLNAAGVHFDASSALRDSLILRPVLVLAQASWEAKFTIAALEEHGWNVETRLAVAPGVDVRQGSGRTAIDTARYAAVVALDSVAARYTEQLADYVRSGGGLVAAGGGAALRALTAVMPAATVGMPSEPQSFGSEVARAAPRSALALAPLRDLRPDAVVLETRTATDGVDQIAAAAWRLQQGRVVQIGYADTWRWRLAASDDEGGEAAHRDWWAAVVSSVAYAPRAPLAVTASLEPTPLASLIDALGQPDTEGWTHGFNDAGLMALLFAVLLFALMLEWLSRRLRGAS